MIVVVGHGRSPEGKRWASLIDSADIVIRLWDWQWQDPLDYGTKYDYGLFVIAPCPVKAFSEHNKRKPAIGWLGYWLMHPDKYEKLVPSDTKRLDTTAWVDIAMKMGGIGSGGMLHLTRGTAAACAAITHANPGEDVVLVGFDNVLKGEFLPSDQAFSPVYLKDYLAQLGGTYKANWYESGTKSFSHDITIEAPLLHKLAEDRQVNLMFAQEVWIGRHAIAVGTPKICHGSPKSISD